MSNENQVVEEVTSSEPTNVDLPKSEPTQEKESNEVVNENTTERSYTEVKDDGTIKVDLSKLSEYQNKTNPVEEPTAKDEVVEEPEAETKEEAQEEVIKKKPSLKNKLTYQKTFRN